MGIICDLYHERSRCQVVVVVSLRPLSAAPVASAAWPYGSGRTAFRPPGPPPLHRRGPPAGSGWWFCTAGVCQVAMNGLTWCWTFFCLGLTFPRTKVNSDSRSDNGSVQKGHIYVSTFPHLGIFMSVTSGHVNFMSSPSPVPILGYRWKISRFMYSTILWHLSDRYPQFIQNRVT